ncbi:hypothetical protein H0O00_04165 [Candidatus Micrarchaeota archaeon]|nr:hypothetical protein [Candidatus Micrarchaeota archaeon]
MLKPLAFSIALFSLFSICSALMVGPRIYEQDDFGDISLDEFTYSISADCTASSITLLVMNGSNRPVRDANAYLKYIDFSTPLMGSGVSNNDGQILFKLPGDVSLMRGLFIIVIEKKGYRSKEVHFDLSPCFTNATNPTPPAKPPKPPANDTNNTQPPGGGTQNDTNQTNPPSQNYTNATNGSGSIGGNVTNGGNETGDGTGNLGLCASSIALPVFLAIIFKRVTRKRDMGVGV